MEYMENQMDDLITGSNLQQEESYSFKLTSSKCFGKTLKDKSDSEYRQLRDNFDHFIEQPLTLGMFVPCDLDGNVLEVPKQTYLTCSFYEQQQFFNKQKQYEEAKERVLFKGYEIFKEAVFEGVVINLSDKKTIYVQEITKIEHITHFEIELSNSAIKQIGL